MRMRSLSPSSGTGTQWYSGLFCVTELPPLILVVWEGTVYSKKRMRTGRLKLLSLLLSGKGEMYIRYLSHRNFWREAIISSNTQ